MVASNGVSHLQPGHLADFPYPCPPGVIGDAEGLEPYHEQSGPSCARACSAGTFCNEAAKEEEPCPTGFFCPAGTSDPQTCEPGTYSYQSGMKDQSQCLPCEPGHWCETSQLLPCGQGTYNPAPGGNSSAACVKCPNGAQTSPGSTSRDQCKCGVGYYMGWDSSDGKVKCIVCPAGTSCTVGGVTLATLPMLTGFYRTGSTSLDLRACPGQHSRSSCAGGAVNNVSTEGPCRPWTRGPLCRLCNVTDSSRYFDDEGSTETCTPCTAGAFALIIGWLVGLATLAALLLFLRRQWYRPRNRRRCELIRAWMVNAIAISSRLSLLCKTKVLFSFFQVVARVPDVYLTQMPQSVASMLHSIDSAVTLSFLRVGIPLQCIGLDSFYRKLLFAVLFPLFVLLICVAYGLTVSWRDARQHRLHEDAPVERHRSSRRLVRDHNHRFAELIRAESEELQPRGVTILKQRSAGRMLKADAAVVSTTARLSTERSTDSVVRAGLLRVFPVILLVVFLAFPATSSLAFRAFTCDSFDGSAP